MTSPPINLDPHGSPVDRSVRGLMSDLEAREEMEKRMDELARRYAETHDEEIKAEIVSSLVEGSLVLTDDSVP